MNRVLSRMRKPARIARGSVLTSAVIVSLAAISTPAFATTGAYGSDGSAPIAVGSNGAYVEPTCSPTTNYDTYTGEVGAATSNGMTKYNAPSTGSSTDQLDNIDRAHNMHSNGHGVGAGSYFFLGGPKWASGGESNSSNAYIWGEDQAIIATDDYNAADTAAAGDFSNLVVMGDAEIQNSSQTNGWDSSHVSYDQQVILGFVNWLQAHSTNVGIYAGPSFWMTYLGSMSLSTVEWTAEGDYGPVTPCPTAIFSGGPGGSGYAAQFFGGDTPSSNNALNWQWTGAGNGGAGDYDQYNFTHYNAVFGTSIVP